MNVADDLHLGILDGVATLVDQSLVRHVEGPDVRRRFTLLETFREFGLARLEEAGETEIVRRAHVDWCLALAEEAEPKLIGPEQGTWLERLETEHDNLRAAIYAANVGSDDAALGIAGALWRFWYMRGYLSEGSRWLARVLENSAASAPAKRARALHGAGVLAQLQGDYPRAEACLGESLLILREWGNQREAATVLRRLGSVAHEQGGDPRAVELIEESLAILEGLGDRRGVAIALGHLGFTAQPQGDFSRAAELMEESLVILRAMGDVRGAANALGGLGSVAYARGDLLQSAGFMRENLVILRELGDRWGLVHSLEIVADMAVSLTRADHGARLLGAAATLRQELGTPAMAVDRARVDRILEELGIQLGEPTLADFLSQGREMNVERAVNEAFAFLERVSRHGSPAATKLGGEALPAGDRDQISP